MKRAIFIFLGAIVKKIKKPLSIAQAILLALALSLLCTAAAGLALCSYQAPELYAQITAPFRAGIQQLSSASQSLWDHWHTRLTDGVHRTASQLREDLQLLATPPEPTPDFDDLQLVNGEAVAPPPRSQASLEITTLITRGEQEYLTGGAREITYYNQTAERWAEEPYGTDPIGGYGCGPTAMAMAVSTLTDHAMDPAQMAQYCVEQGYWAKKHGSYRSIVAGVAEDFGLTCTSLSPEEADFDTVSRYLSSGRLIVALMGPGHFTNVGHFILLRGVTLDNSILVADPASTERSLTTWDLELLLSELSASRDSGAPLWVLSQDFF